MVLREGVGTERELAWAIRDEVAFQQALVDSAEMLDGQVPVVDPARRQPVRTLARHRVHQRDEHAVRQGEARQEAARPVMEQPAIIGRQAHGGVTLGDGAEQGQELRPPSDCASRQDPVHVGNLFGLLAQAAQGVRLVAGVPDGQQVAILGVEQEQQPEQQPQRALPRLRAPGGIIDPYGRVMAGNGVHEVGEYHVEHDIREGRGNAGLIAPALIQRQGEEVDSRPVRRRQERVPVKNEQEHAEPVIGRRIGGDCRPHAIEERGQVELDESFRARRCLRPIEAPGAAVGQQPPPDCAVRGGFGPHEVSEDLGGGCLTPAARAVQHGVTRLVLHDNQAELEAGRIVQAQRRGSVGWGGEEQRIGNVVPTPGRGLLAQMRPAKAGKERVDENVFGFCFPRPGH